MLRWDEVRRLIVRHVCPAVSPLGFTSPGRTMRRFRGPFVDVIDFRCGKWGTSATLQVGCGLRRFTKANPKPCDCQFGAALYGLPWEELDFKDTAEAQVESLLRFAPAFAREVERWFGLLPDLATARAAVERLTSDRSPDDVAFFVTTSPAYHRVVRDIEAAMAMDAGAPPVL